MSFKSMKAFRGYHETHRGPHSPNMTEQVSQPVTSDKLTTVALCSLCATIALRKKKKKKTPYASSCKGERQQKAAYHSSANASLAAPAGISKLSSVR